MYRGTEYFTLNQSFPFIAIDGMFKRTLTLFSLSKSHGTAGYIRIGFAVAPKEIINHIKDKIFATMSHVPTVSQSVLPLGFQNSSDSIQLNEYLSTNVREYQVRLKLLRALIEGIDAIEEIDRQFISEIISAEYHKLRIENSPALEEVFKGLPGVKISTPLPMSGFFALVDFSSYRDSYIGDTKIRFGSDLAEVFGREAGLLSLFDEMMGISGDLLIHRISFSLSREEIVKSMLAICNVLMRVEVLPRFANLG